MPDAPATTTAPATAPVVAPPVVAEAAPAAAQEAPKPLQERLMARAQERQAREAEAQRGTELAELRAQVAALTRQQPAQGSGIDIKALQADPIGTLRAAGVDVRAFLRTATQGVLKPDVARLEQRLEELANKPAEQGPDAAAVALQVYEQQQHKAETYAEFDALCTAKGEGDAPTRPMVARLDRAERRSRGDDIANEFISKGVDITLDEIADVLEERLLDEYRRVTGGEDPPHLRSQPAAVNSGTSKASSGRAATKAASAVITNDLASAGNPRAPSSRDEKRAAADALLRASLFPSG